MSDPRPLHRLFGLSWTDFFRGTAITVEMEIDLSLKQQFLDLVIIRKGAEPIPRPLPDGFEDLAAYNLVTFKSYQEALDGWALCELVGHYVNYRKQSSPSMQELLPESDFRLFAVCARYPHNLAQQVALTAVRDGVYETRLVTMPARVIVVHQLPQEENNALLHLFSAREEQLRYGRDHYRPHSEETSTLLYELFQVYGEGLTMSDKLKEFVRESLDNLFRTMPLEEILKRVPVERILKGLPPEELVKGVPAEERLKGVPAEEILKRLSPEEIAQALPPKERLKGLSPEEIAQALPPKERLKGLSPEEIAQALPPEVLKAIARWVKANGSEPKSS